MMYFKFLVVLIIEQSGIAFAMPMTEGYFKVVRHCSDESVPRDALGNRPLMIHFAADGRFESLAQVDNRCSQYTSGLYELTFEHLSSRVITTQACPPCPLAARTDLVTQRSILQSNPRGFTLQLLTDYQAGGSCLPGQSMRIDFIRQRLPAPMIPICAIAMR